MKKQFIPILLAIGLIAVLLAASIGAADERDPAEPTGPCIPYGTIDSATLKLYVTQGNDVTVNVHRITDPWQEMGVTWNSFGGAYDPAVVASFAVTTSDEDDWIEVDVTGLVQDWLDGTYPNYGFLLESGPTARTGFASNEEGDAGDLFPVLEICYTKPGLSQECVVIQGPGTGDDDSQDANISQQYPGNNYGGHERFYLGLVPQTAYEKQALIRFHFQLCEQGGEGCTPGYWKQEQHFDSWGPTGYAPGDDFASVFGCAIEIMWSEKGKPQPVSDPTLLQALEANGGGINALARHAVAALLNAAHPDTSYLYTPAEIIAMVQDAACGGGDIEAAKDALATQNEMGCPLN